MFLFEFWSLSGEAVGPAQDSEFFAEGSGGPDESLGRVVGTGTLHKPDLEVQSRECRGQIGADGGEPESSADVVGEPRAQGIVCDEQYPPLELAPCQGFGDVVEQGGYAKVRQDFGVYFGFQAFLFGFAVDSPDSFEDVIPDI